LNTEKKRTKTASFGVNGRRSHDSSAYYARRINEDASQNKKKPVKYSENPLPDHLVNRVLLDTCVSPVKSNRLPPRSVHLMVTSPPYAVGKDYDEDLSLSEYRKLLKGAWRETRRVLVPGGRVCINVASIGRKPYIPLHAYIIQDMERLGFLMRGEIIWDKGSSAGSSTAWGSWRSASNPCIRDQHEYILVFSKGSYQRPKVDERSDTIGRDDFLDFTRSIWHMNAESAKRVGHPAPFPVELPRRCIEMYTYTDEVIFDPFMGSGTTGVAAIESGRRFVGYETDTAYQQRATQRINATQLDFRYELLVGEPAD